MEYWEKAYEEYILADYTTDEEEKELLFQDLQKYAALAREYKDFFGHPLYRKIVVKMMNDHEIELKEAFHAGWEAHQQFLQNKH